MSASSNDAAQTHPELVAWHGGWTLVVLAGGGLTALVTGGLTGEAAAALILGFVPGVAGLFLTAFTAPYARSALLGLWAICGGLACVVTGGIDGPMAAWCLAPLAAATVLVEPKGLAKGAAISLAAVVLAAAAQLGAAIGYRPEGMLALCLATLSFVTVALGLGAGLVLSRRRQRAVTTAQERANEALRGLLNAQPNLILHLFPSGRVAKSFGAAPAGVELRGLEYSLIDAARAEDRPMVRDALNTALATGASEVLFVSEQALDKVMCLELRALGDRTLLGTLRDVTAHQAQIEVLEQARVDAENLAAGRAQFLAGMSHELRTPLNAIMGFSDIMRNKMFGELPGKYVEYADLIHESGSHLLDLINDVLDMSKIEARRYELSIEAMDPREPVAAALRIMRLQADDVGVSLRASLPATAPDVDADRRAIKQIVLNLVSNALKFTPRGGSVTLTLAVRGQDLELTVADTGVGIAEADLARIGRPYEQVGDVGKKALGTGLGLSLVRSFAELHGGEMTIESRLGEGTAVTVRLPVVHEVRPAGPPTGGNVVAFNPQR